MDAMHGGEIACLHAGFCETMRGIETADAKRALCAVDDVIEEAALRIEKICGDAEGGKALPDAKAAILARVRTFAESTRQMEEGISRVEARGADAGFLVEIVVSATERWLLEMCEAVCSLPEAAREET